MIDTHAHLFLEQFDEDFDQTLTRARESNVREVLLPNIDSTTTDAMWKAAEKDPLLFPMMGLHPCSVKENYQDELNHVRAELERRKYIAVGEIGTDLYWDKTFWSEQKEAFNIQCELAITHELPVVIHCRESITETIELVRPWAKKGLTGVFHCFTGDEIQAASIVEMGFYLGVGGVLTFKNGGLDKVAAKLDRQHVLLETDSPYLAPAPKRGKRNEPAYLNLVAVKLGEIWGMEIAEVDELTSTNARRLFNIS